MLGTKEMFPYMGNVNNIEFRRVNLRRLQGGRGGGGWGGYGESIQSARPLRMSKLDRKLS